MDALDPTIPVATYSMISGKITLVGSPLPDIIKIPMYVRLYVILPIQYKGSVMSLTEITHMLEGTNPVLICIIVSLLENLVFPILINYRL